MKALGWLGPPRSLAVLGVALFACSSPEKLGAAGDQCLQVTDCSLGLACVPTRDGTRDGTSVCSADLSPIVPIQDAGMAADSRSRPDVGLDAVATGDGGGSESASDDGGPAEASLPPLEAGPDSASAVDDAGRAVAPDSSGD